MENNTNNNSTSKIEHTLNKKVIVSLKNITKTYKLPHLVNQTFFESMLHMFTPKQKIETFHALKDVSFDVYEGEILGIIGRNGSGKTTLLKIIAGIIPPTSGTVQLKKPVTPFLDMGIGFHPNLTAKENILLYGIIMGIPKNVLQKEMKKILRFADVEKFADVQLKKFSSGMNARLAYSTMIRTKGSLYLLDEIFAVGDKNFAPKCKESFKVMTSSGKTIILVSHSLELIKDYCDRAVLLEKGEVQMISLPEKTVNTYKKKY